MIVGYLDLQLSMQSMLITINVMSSDLAHVEVCLIQHYVIQLLNDMQYVGAFLQLDCINIQTFNLIRSERSNVRFDGKISLFYIFFLYYYFFCSRIIQFIRTFGFSYPAFVVT